jgi:hypothetical protein
MKFQILPSLLIAWPLVGHGTTLQMVPMQGAFPTDPVADMVHVYVVFNDRPTNTVQLTLDPATPQLTPLAVSHPGDGFDASDPWYGDLEPLPNGQGLAFSRRYGFLVETASSDPLPAGLGLGIRLLSSTPGLQMYFYRNTTGDELMDPVFLASPSQPGVTPNDSLLWNGNMWHPLFTAPASEGMYDATFEVFVTSNSTAAVVDCSTPALPATGYAPAQITLSFTAIPVPEPGLPGLLGAGVLWVATHMRRRAV